MDDNHEEKGGQQYIETLPTPTGENTDLTTIRTKNVRVSGQSCNNIKITSQVYVKGFQNIFHFNKPITTRFSSS